MITYELAERIGELHTTEMGAERIKRNLNLGVCDAVKWCQEQVAQCTHLSRKGKNWYAVTKDAVITINARSLTIITAHPPPLEHEP